MRLLFLTPYLPGPPLFGGARRIRGLMSELSRSHEVSLLALVDASADQGPAVAAASRYCASVATVEGHWHEVTGKPKRLLQLGSLAAPWSWEKLLYLRPAFQRALDRELQQHPYDAVVCEFVFMAHYRFSQGEPRPRLILDEHNIEYDLVRRTAQAASGTRRVFQELNWRKLRREETALWRSFDACTLTSARDETLVRRAVPEARTRVVPNGVDVEDFVPPEGEPEPNTVLFFGAINYYPNADGALYCAREILPRLREADPTIRLRIVGPVDDGPVTDLRADGVEVVGFVEDVKHEIARATAVIVPLRIGGGTRLKILEAMAMGKAVISTSLGAEGLDVEHTKDILLADDPDTFAREVLSVLQTPALRARLGVAARHTAVARYSWRAAADKMESILRDVV